MDGVLCLLNKRRFVNVFVSSQPVLEKNFIDLFLEEMGVLIIKSDQLDLLTFFVSKKDPTVLNKHGQL
jgi:hypothetical protein